MSKCIILVANTDEDFASACEIAYNKGSGMPKENIVFDSYEEAKDWCDECCQRDEYQIVELEGYF